jgi:hypothetical protein
MPVTERYHYISPFITKTANDFLNEPELIPKHKAEATDGIKEEKQKRRQNGRSI